MKEDNVNLAIQWFLYSGIQNLVDEKDSEGNSILGSFNAWYDLEKQRHSYVYTEISGYALTTLLFLYEKESKQEFLERAKLVGDWLVGIQNEDGSMGTAYYLPGVDVQKPDSYHTFDVGMVFNGLALMYKVSHEQKYLDSAKKAADWVISYQKEDGSIPAQVSRENGEVTDSEKTWSTQSGSFHSKLAIGLLNIYDLTKDEKYKKSAIGLCDYALTRQEISGQFLTYGEQVGTNMHPHLYSAEGLFVAGSYLKESRYLDASRKAVEWTISLYKDGLVPRHKHDDRLNYNSRIDIISQALRMAVIFQIDIERHEELSETILKYQYNGEPKVQQGGIAFGHMSDGKDAPHLNCWVTMFAIQALSFYVDGGIKFDPFYIV